MQMQIKDLGEFGLIKALLRDQPHFEGVIVPAGDDAAVVEITSGMRIVYTCDCMVEDVHFLATARGEDVGFKLLASNISDIAAMGGKPRFAVITLVAPGETLVEWLQDVYRGLGECCVLYGVALVGGDTSRGPKIMLNIALIGEIEPGKEMLRKNAQVGDLVCVTGPLGGSAAGLRVVTGKVPRGLPVAPYVLAKHYQPHPRVEEGQALTRLGCKCANDISDGLASEALEIAEASGVSIELVDEDIPICSKAEQIAKHSGEDPLGYALYGGEDYELVFCIAPSLLPHLIQVLPGASVVGTVKRGQGVSLLSASGARPINTAYNHFNKGDL
ncbi:MAG: thiamine-monophosphate kinase [Bacillota bacterium]|nr:MAG: thiamine-monophosphate kinase [Bacillota bacterium]